MQSRTSMTTWKWEGGESGHHTLPSRLADCLSAGRRQILVSHLFEYLKEVQHIDDGYALQFDRSDGLEDLWDYGGLYPVRRVAFVAAHLCDRWRTAQEHLLVAGAGA